MALIMELFIILKHAVLGESHVQWKVAFVNVNAEWVNITLKKHMMKISFTETCSYLIINQFQFNAKTQSILSVITEALHSLK